MSRLNHSLQRTPRRAPLTLTGIRHDSIPPTPVFDNYVEYAALAARSLWGASGGISTNHRVVHVNRNPPTAMRSPHEALGHFALESAMDSGWAIGRGLVTPYQLEAFRFLYDLCAGAIGELRPRFRTGNTHAPSIMIAEFPSKC